MNEIDRCCDRTHPEITARCLVSMFAVFGYSRTSRDGNAKNKTRKYYRKPWSRSIRSITRNTCVSQSFTCEQTTILLPNKTQPISNRMAQNIAIAVSWLIDGFAQSTWSMLITTQKCSLKTISSSADRRARNGANVARAATRCKRSTTFSTFSRRARCFDCVWSDEQLNFPLQNEAAESSCRVLSQSARFRMHRVRFSIRLNLIIIFWCSAALHG